MAKTTKKASPVRISKTGDFYVVSGGVSSTKVTTQSRDRAYEIATARKAVVKKRKERLAKAKK